MLTEEAFTSENWIVRLPASSFFLSASLTLSSQKQVRIYAVKKEDNLGRDHRSASAFDGGKRKKRTKLPVASAAKKKIGRA
jgi:dolichyl-diphosphooligosaccharide--protein glycosyltransferase